MKLLHMTPEAPGKDSGGRLGVLQTTLSLTLGGDCVDYIGPPIDDPLIAKRYARVFELEKSKNIVKLFINYLRGITNRSYNSWKNASIDYNAYDYVVLDFTKQSYVLEKVNPHKLIVRVHNVEVDYASRNLLTDKSVKNQLIRKKTLYQETCLVKKAHKLVVLTLQDKKRLMRLYKVPCEKFELVPVCLNDSMSCDTVVSDDNYMIITGSLWFGENYKGIKWFLYNVLPYLKTESKLIIAGNRPNNELSEIVRCLKNVELIDSPQDMKPYFEKASLSIAPVFNGAGMKVKVAEALSYALPVVGTRHALIGYNVHNGIDSFEANDAKEFIECIDGYFSLERNDRLLIRNKARELYINNYSIDVSAAKWKKILN